MDDDPIEVLVDSILKDHRVVIFSLDYCRFCKKVKDLFNELKIEYYSLEVNDGKNEQAFRQELIKRTNQKTFPNIFIRGNHIGGCDVTLKHYTTGKLFDFLEGNFSTYDYDLIVIGGGSGGIAAAKEAALQGMKVALFDFVKPTNHGTKWGVGGTCVNVGCIPKKLMHQASIIGDVLGDTSAFGWNLTGYEGPSANHNWQTLIINIQNYIKSLNFNYIKYFRKNKIEYFNEYAVFKDSHTIQSSNKAGNLVERTAQNFVLATGGRPHIPDFPGSELCITSDDLFSLKDKPGKTLVVGASYIALECAGFLNGLGIDCTVMVRSILLRGFDQQISTLIGAHMESHGLKFLKGFVPNKVVQTGDPNLPLEVYYQKVGSDPVEQCVERFQTVLLAVGRNACVYGLGLEALGIQLNERTQKIRVDQNDRSTCRTVYAIGDIQDGRMELTPVAIKAGNLLAQRLNGKGHLMDYDLVPTTVFTPLEYGSVGLSEDGANETYGKENVECFHSIFQPLEWALSKRDQNRCYAKLICLKNEQMRVVGFHVLGPNAGEITQGFALGLRLGAKKEDFDSLVGIHPVCAEVFTTMKENQPLTSDTSSGC